MIEVRITHVEIGNERRYKIKSRYFMQQRVNGIVNKVVKTEL